MSRSNGRRGSAGFTVVELMIVIVVVGILMFVGLPAYQNSILKSNRGVGKGMLLDVQQRQAQFFINNKTYTDSLTDLGYEADPFYVDDQANTFGGAGSTIYKIDLDLLTTTTYTLTATARGRQGKDTRCKALGLTSEGVKSVKTGAGTRQECW